MMFHSSPRLHAVSYHKDIVVYTQSFPVIITTTQQEHTDCKRLPTDFDQTSSNEYQHFASIHFPYFHTGYIGGMCQL